MYRKPTHIGLYLHNQRHHHPVQKASVMSTLIHRVHCVADSEHLTEELETLKVTFSQNGYSKVDIEQTKNEDDVIRGVAIVSFCNTITNCLTCLLQRRKIKMVLRPPLKMKHLMKSVQDPLGLHVPGVYKALCDCGVSYVGQAGRTCSH